MKAPKYVEKGILKINIIEKFNILLKRVWKTLTTFGWSL
jgi:hypothetical protein